MKQRIDFFLLKTFLNFYKKKPKCNDVFFREFMLTILYQTNLPFASVHLFNIYRSSMYVHQTINHFCFIFCINYSFWKFWNENGVLNNICFDTENNGKKILCQKWDSNPRPHSWTRMLTSLKRRVYS